MIYKFCPKCGGKLGKIKEENHQRLVCQNCHFVFYQNSKPTASAIIFDDKKRILLTKRAVEPKKNYWDFPGGFLEEGEYPQDGLKREIFEELGVKIKIIKMLGIFMDNYKTDGVNYSTLNIYYLVKIIHGQLKPMSDIMAIRWFGKEELPPKKIAFKSNIQAIKTWLKI